MPQHLKKITENKLFLYKNIIYTLTESLLSILTRRIYTLSKRIFTLKFSYFY